MDGLIGDSQWAPPARGAKVKVQKLSSIKGCDPVSSIAISRAEEGFGVIHPPLQRSFPSHNPLEALRDFPTFISACCFAGPNRNMGRWLLMGAIYDGKNWNRKNWL
jgi:hypothetical protein